MKTSVADAETMTSQAKKLLIGFAKRSSMKRGASKPFSESQGRKAESGRTVPTANKTMKIRSAFMSGLSESVRILYPLHSFFAISNAASISKASPNGRIASRRMAQLRPGGRRRHTTLSGQDATPLFGTLSLRAVAPLCEAAFSRSVEPERTVRGRHRRDWAASSDHPDGGSACTAWGTSLRNRRRRLLQSMNFGTVAKLETACSARERIGHIG